MPNPYLLLQTIGDEPVRGRTKLQKIVYFLQDCGFQFQEHFRLYYYGPFSVGLTNTLNWLQMNGLVEEDVTQDGKYTEYKYETTPEGNEVLENFSIKNRMKFDRIRNLLVSKSTRELEVASTMKFLMKMDYSGKKLVSKLRELKKASSDEISTAKDLVSEIERLKKKKSNKKHGRSSKTRK